jgi:hypothetical protein
MNLQRPMKIYTIRLLTSNCGGSWLFKESISNRLVKRCGFFLR